MRKERILFLLTLLYCSAASALVVKWEPVNNSCCDATDLHLTVTSSISLPLPTVTQSFPLGTAKITDQGTTTVSLDWDTVINPTPPPFNNLRIKNGDKASVGMTFPDPERRPSRSGTITLSGFWTQDGVPLLDGRIPIVDRIVFPDFPQGPDVSKIIVVREVVYDPCQPPRPDCNVPSPVGNVWIEGLARGLPMLENTTGSPVFASIAFGVFDQAVPIDALNPTLAGMGQASPITLFAPTVVPEPATWILLFTGFFGLQRTKDFKRK
jgi:hypothetical protein